MGRASGQFVACRRRNQRIEATLPEGACGRRSGDRLCDAGVAAVDPPPEIQRIGLDKIRSLCRAPVYVAEALLRANRVGHVVLTSTVDRPWSPYSCCLAAADREYIQMNPVATRRAPRAIIKTSDICASDPDRGAKAHFDLGLPDNRWRELNPEDTMRFCALRLPEARLIKSSPQQRIARVTDWRFTDQLKKELKT